jgi:anti-sigma factor RsiW
MNDETIERLIMDRALGALEDDVAALLDAYLKADPRAAERARQASETVDLARRVLAAPASGESPAPPFPRLWIEAAERRRRRRRFLKQAAALAACLVIGVALGTLLFGGRASLPVSSPGASPGAFLPQAAATMGPPPATVARADGGEGGFWSASRLWNRRNQAADVPPASPLRGGPNSAPSSGGES